MDSDEGPLEFFRIISAGFSGDGSIVLADVGNFALVVFPPGGGPILIHLTEGDGPGEGRYISQVGFLQGDTIYWIDSFLRRINLLRVSTGERLDPVPMTYEPNGGRRPSLDPLRSLVARRPCTAAPCGAPEDRN